LWKEFLVHLGFDVVESPRTTRATIDRGISLTVDDTCVPVKALVGHVDGLLNRSIQYLFLPRVVALRKDGRTFYPCPKMIGLPDVVKAVFHLDKSTSPAVLEMEVDERKEPMAGAMVRFARQTLGAGRRDAVTALGAAEKAQQEYQQELCSTDKGQGNRKIAVVGHPYLMFDDYLSLGLLRKLRDLGADVVTQYALTPEELEKGMREFWWVSWGYEREILGAISHFADTGAVDGIVYVTSFGCGPFAVLSELVARSIRSRTRVPVQFLMMDELTGEAGVLTRVESFMDMLDQKR
jgi:predicted nucleotide-binding protein (sugar kinase/HSP70/actin superfamily)